MLCRAIVTTCATTPLAIWIYPGETQQDGIEFSSKNKNILVVLNKVEYILPMMTLIRLIQSSSVSNRDYCSVSSNEKGVPSSSDDDAITVHALRLMGLGQRMSGVMKSHESAEVAHRDPIMNVFGQQYSFNVESTFSIRPFNNFAEQVLQTAKQSSAKLIIVPS